MNYFQRRKRRKQLHALAHHARGLRNMREDLLSAADLANLDAAIHAAELARLGSDETAMTEAEQALGARIDALTPHCSAPGWRENFEVLVVALGVAMAFRAYFYQPFQIPTGSMQPTLYGISSRELDAPQTFDAPVLKAAKWLVTGEWFSRTATRRAGKIAVLWGDDRVPGYTTVVCGNWPGAWPSDEVCPKDSVVTRSLYALGGRLGLLDRGYDVYFLPNDVAARHAGVYRAGFLPPAAVQAQVSETLRKNARWLQRAAADNADAEARTFALQNAFPVVFTVANWSRDGHGQLDEATQQAVLGAYQVCDVVRHGRTVDRAQAQRVCSRLERIFTDWADAAAAGSSAIPWFPLLSGCGVECPAGQLLWSGVVTEGDFVFVNRWAWNFRLPRRGEVMVFSTSNIRGLMQGTHFIKRMCGLPNETLSIHPPELWIDGKAVYEPHAIARVARREQLAPWALPYAGYRVAPEGILRSPDDSIKLAADEYFAMGDNTANSLDGRYWGPVPRRNLLGPGAMVYWPFTSKRWGRIE